MTAAASLLGRGHGQSASPRSRSGLGCARSRARFYTSCCRCAGGAPAIRAFARLEPAGGPSDKVFPPTYVKERNATTSTRWNGAASTAAKR